MKRYVSGGWFAVLLFVMVTAATPVAAVQMSGLYESEVPVAGQDAAQRSEAISNAFADVLVKVTGSRRIVDRSDVSAEIADASRYVQQYRYRLLDSGQEMTPQETETAEEAVDKESGRLLQVIFDKPAVDLMLRNLGLPVWDANRPGGLVWIGVEQKGARRLLAEKGRFTEYLETGAARRGLQLMFPLMDLEDQANLQMADLWGDFESNIRSASQRYSPDLVLTGKLINVAQGHWRASWRLYHGPQVSSWDDQASDQEGLATAAIEKTADLLAERFAPLGTEGGMNKVRVRVNGVEGFSDYTNLERFLESQSAVDRVELIAVESDAMVYDLHTRGGTLVLEQGLGVGGMLSAKESSAGFEHSVDTGIDLFYRLR